MSEWSNVLFKDIAIFNPKESIKKGTIATKVGMDKLQPFCRDVPEIERVEFSGGTKFRNEDTIMARITPCLENGKTAMINVLEKGEVGFGSTEYIVFRAKPGITDPHFLYYLVCSPLVREPAIKSMVGSSGRQRVQTDVVQNLEIKLPSIAEQKKIGEVLRKLDDKIAVNNQINRNLSEQSQMIVRSYMDSKSYEMKPLSEIAEIIDCLHSKKPAAVEDGDKQLIQLDNITNTGFLDLDALHFMISDEDYKLWTRKCEIVEGDCVITNVGRVGAVSQAPSGTHAAMGRNMTCIRLKPECPWYAYIITMLLSDHMKREINKNTDVGTIMNALNVKDIPKLLFPIFSEIEMGNLEHDLKAVRGLIEGNYLENQRLVKLRDTLLPKLMSGELDVSNLDI